MKNWWQRLQAKRVPKIRLGDEVKIMYGNQVLAYMTLVEFSDCYSGGKEARLIDTFTYRQRNRVS
jgi:hypothetical protein